MDNRTEVIRQDMIFSAKPGKNLPEVFTGRLTELAMIISCPSGTVYIHQSGGTSNLGMSAEGVLVPLGGGSEPITRNRPSWWRIYRHFTDKYNGRTEYGIDAETADLIDEVLSSDGWTKYLSVDRSYLRESREAFVHIKLDFPENPNPNYYMFFSEKSYKTGVLLWPNSD